MLFVLLVITGLAVGLLSSFFGVGGGIVTVPMLYTVFPNIPPQTVIGCSLGIICLNSIINTRNFILVGKKPDTKTSLIMGVFMIFGVVIGGKLTMTLEPKMIKQIFAFFLVAVAFKSLFAKIKSSNQLNWKPSHTFSFIIKTALLCLVGGVISGLTGLGGGAILVPLFMTVLHIPSRFIPAYSNVAMGLGTFAGTITYMVAKPDINIFENTLFSSFQVGYVNFGIIFLVFIGSFFTSKLGVGLTDKISPKTSKNLFGILLLVIASKIFYSLYS